MWVSHRALLVGVLVGLWGCREPPAPSAPPRTEQPPPAAASAHDVGSGYYQGQLFDLKGGADYVGVSLCIDGGSVWGSYFDLRVGTEIALHGTRSADGTVRLEESLSDGPVTGVWSGRLDAGFTGTLTSPSGDRRRFELPKVGAIPADASVAPKGVDPQHCGDIGYRWVRVSEAGENYFPRLVRFRDPAMMADVNRQIDAFVKSWFEELDTKSREYCGGDFEASHESDQSVVEYASTDVFSIRVTGEFGCYVPGAGLSAKHTLDDSLTFDLGSGDRMQIEDLFKPGLPWPEIFPVLFAYQIAEAAKPGSDECLRQYDPTKLFEFQVAFHFSADGLVVGPSEYGLLSPVDGCEQRTVVPYRALLGLVEPASALGRAASTVPADAPMRYRIRNWYGDFDNPEIVFEPTGRRPPD